MILPNRNAKKRKSIFQSFGRELAVGESKCMKKKKTHLRARLLKRMIRE